MMMRVPVGMPVGLRVVCTIHASIRPLLLHLGIFLCLDHCVDSSSFSRLVSVHSSLCVWSDMSDSTKGF